MARESMEEEGNLCSMLFQSLVDQKVIEGDFGSFCCGCSSHTTSRYPIPFSPTISETHADHLLY